VNVYSNFEYRFEFIPYAAYGQRKNAILTIIKKTLGSLSGGVFSDGLEKGEQTRSNSAGRSGDGKKITAEAVVIADSGNSKQRGDSEPNL
jgi:hypothetical protein